MHAYLLGKSRSNLSSHQHLTWINFMCTSVIMKSTSRIPHKCFSPSEYAKWLVYNNLLHGHDNVIRVAFFFFVPYIYITIRWLIVINFPSIFILSYSIRYIIIHIKTLKFIIISEGHPIKWWFFNLFLIFLVLTSINRISINPNSNIIIN